MSKIKRALWLFIIVLTLLWVLANNFPEQITYFSLRNLMNQYSGMIAMGAMSLSMLLATRIAYLEKYFNGLDKIYRLHKWLGITALTSAIIHFWFTKGTKWMISWGWLDKPVRPKVANKETLVVHDIESLFRSLRGAAEGIGEWAFYIALILMVISLIKIIPYHWFKRTHKWLAATYLLFVFHGTILINFTYWQQPIGIILGILLTAGTISAFTILLNQVGKKRKIVGTIHSISPISTNAIYELQVDVEQWPSHKPGQFAFISQKTEKNEIHPFTIASSWKDDGILRFLIKGLGDYTNQLTEKFKKGNQIYIEGPYGCFNFNDTQTKQIWIATGIGITPFISRLEELKENPTNQNIYLYYCYNQHEEILISELKNKATQANVELILWNSKEKGHLSAKHIASKSANLADTSIWFCGYAQMGKNIRDEFIKLGLKTNNFHQELFEMR